MMYEERTQERQSAMNDMLGTMAGIALTRGSTPESVPSKRDNG